jgi:hypothetical protein
VAISWTKQERDTVEQGMTDHPLNSGRCAALARVVYKVASVKDPEAHGVQIRPKRGARYLVPKPPHVPYWFSHTLVETQGHDIDAITGPDGHDAQEYLEQYWHFHETLDVRSVDVETIDPGIEDTEA